MYKNIFASCFENDEIFLRIALSWSDYYMKLHTMRHYVIVAVYDTDNSQAQDHKEFNLFILSSQLSCLPEGKHSFSLLQKHI